MMPRPSLIWLALTYGILVPRAVSAAEESKPKPVSDWTCLDFLAVDDKFKPKVVYAASVASQGTKPSSTFIDIAGTEMVTPMIIDDCTKQPTSSFLQQLKSDWSKVKADAKADGQKLRKAL
jgi:acid stress chaperone HdeA